MGLIKRQLDPKVRRRVALGNVCLALGLVLFFFVHPANQTLLNITHGVSGLLLGISIGINLFAWRLARRCREKQA
jgi:hypothetical protein